MNDHRSSIDIRLEVAIVVAVLVASLGLRMIGLDTFVVNDEMRWTCRSIGFQEALRRGDWASTFRTGHPGVITTWLGTMFIPFDAADAEAREACQITPDASELSESGDTPEERTELMHRVRDLLFRARRGVALFTWMSFVGMYLLVRHLWGVRVALLSLALMATDPFFLALSRILHVDGALTSTMTMSVLGLVAALRESAQTKRIGFLVLSGVMSGLAILQKSPAMFLGPFAVFLVAIDLVRTGLNRQALLRAIRDLFIWGLIAIIVYVAFWPTMWVQPVETMRRILDMALGYAAEGHSSGNYFMGRPNEDPGWLFYPVATPFRLSPLALVGLIASSVWVLKKSGTAQERRSTSDLLLYGVAFGAFMTLGNKMFDRYLVPVYPSLEIAASVGLWWLADTARERLSDGMVKLLSPLPVAMLTLVIQLAITLPHYPHYLTYYNPLLGGIDQAKKLLLVGWGEGYEQAAAYLNDKPNVKDLIVNMPAFPVFAPQFDGITRSMEKYSTWGSDYVMFYLSHVQRQRYDELMNLYLYNPAAEPERVFSLHGVDYIWLYHNDHYEKAIEYVEKHGEADEGECILVNEDSLFAKYYEGDLPLLTFDAFYDNEEDTYFYWTRDQMATYLDYLPPSCQKIWYLSYPEQEEEDYYSLLHRRGVELDRAPLPHVDVTLHRMVESGIGKRSVNLQFGDLMLRSIAQTDPSLAWGRDGGLVLEWEALAPLEEDYSAFLHLYDAHGHRIAQGDTLITDKDLEPTSRWETGSAHSTVYHLPIPPEAPPGTYDLDLGVYLLETGERLALQDRGEETEEKSATFQIEVGVPDEPPEPTALPVLQRLDYDVLPPLRLLGYTLEHEGVLAGESVPVRLFWKALSKMNEDYQLLFSMRRGGEVVGKEGAYDLVTTDHPTSQWQRGETVAEWYYLPTEKNLSTGDVTLELTLLDATGESVLPEPVRLAELWVQSREASFDVPKQIGERSQATLGEKISLLGYDVEPVAKPGSDLEITITWQALEEMEQGYKVFVHLYDGEGGILGQQDRIPGLGVRPTTTWQAGEVLQDRYRVPVPENTPGGAYQLAVGMYDPETGERLAVSDPAGGILDHDRVSLGEVEIRPR